MLAAALRQAVTKLRQAGVPDPEVSARLLAGVVLRLKSPAAVDAAAAGGRSLDSNQAAKLAGLLDRRCAREPLQYILGEWDFGGLTLKVRKPTLVPRPETEVLAALATSTVKRLLAQSQRSGARPVLLLEVGIGSGALSLAVLRALAKAPAVHLVGVDVSEAAVALAQENAADLLPQIARETGVSLDSLQRRLLFLCRDATAFEGGADPEVAAWAPTNSSTGSSHAHAFDLLFSNPPYIPCEDESSLEPEVAAWEDPRALFGGPPFGLGLTLSMLARAAGGQGKAGWLRGGGAGHVLLETHIDHPALLALGLNPSAALAAAAAAGAGSPSATGALAAWSGLSHEVLQGAQAADAATVASLRSAAPLLLPPPGYPLPSSWAAGPGGATPVPPLDLSPGLVRLGAAAASPAPTLPTSVLSSFTWRQAYCDLTGRPRFVHLVTST